MNILLSIKPKYANLIYRGLKTVEFRKTAPNIEIRNGFLTKKSYRKNKENFVYAFLYETLPIGKITGCFFLNNIFDISKIHNLQDALDCLKDETEKDLNGGITDEEYERYFSKSKKQYAFEIDGCFEFEKPFSIEEIMGKKMHPPMSWRYLNKYFCLDQVCAMKRRDEHWDNTQHWKNYCIGKNYSRPDMARFI